MMPDLVFYDGHCGLCHRTVRYALRHDPDGSRFRYAPIGGATFGSTLGHLPAGLLPDSVVVRTAAGDVLARSAAMLHLGRRLGGGWTLVTALAGFLPRRLLDALYDAVARVRHRIFRRPTGTCPTIPPEWRGRFLP
jgi:predicted DCC family thiol-disulfide oxidoreductase YuxK